MDTIAEVVVGEAMFLQNLMPDGEWIELQGVVAHHSPTLGFGVRFVNLNEEQQCQLRSLITRTNPNQDKSDEASQSRETPASDQIDEMSRHVM